jgi:hypothetical protein
MTYSDNQPTAMHFERLGAELDDDAIIELTALIAFQNLSSKFNAALNETPQAFCYSADRPAISSKT